MLRAEQRQGRQLRSVIPTEGIRLVRPIQVAQCARIPIEMMLGLKMIPDDLIDGIGPLFC